MSAPTTARCCTARRSRACSSSAARRSARAAWTRTATRTLAAGVRLDAIKALRYGHEEDLTEDEAFLAAFIRATVSGTMTDDLWDRMVERMGAKATIEYALFTNYLLMTIRNIQVLTVYEPPDEEIDQLIADLESGAREVPDFTVRLR
jgi:hypothetical protein